MNDGDLITLSKYPTMATPWATAGAGETWLWGDFFATFQTSPPTLVETMNAMSGQPRRPGSLVYLYAMTVFYRRDLFPSSLPVLSVGLEQADYDAAALTGRLPAGAQTSGLGSMFFGMFTATERVNLGQYDGPADPQTVRDELLRLIASHLGLSGSPTLMGTIAESRKHPMIALSSSGDTKIAPVRAKRSSGCAAAMFTFTLLAGGVIWLFSR